MNNKKIYIKFVFVIFVLFLFTGCGYTEEEKAQMKRYEENGKKNAIEYVENKYGFTPTITGVRVLKVDSGPVPDLSPAPTGMVDVSMSYEDVTFTVNISGQADGIDNIDGKSGNFGNVGKDDYQKGEITQAFCEWLSKELSIEIMDIDVQYFDDCMIADYFTDVESFLASIKNQTLANVSIKTFDNISDATVETISSDGMSDGMVLLVVSCRNQEGLKVVQDSKYLSEQNYKLNFYNLESVDNKLSEYAFFINGYVFRNAKGDVQSSSYEVEQVEDGIYYAYHKSEDGSGATVTVTSDMAPADDWKKDSGKNVTIPTFENPVKDSESYAVDFGELSKLQIYVKQTDKQLADSDTERYIAMQYDDENGTEVLTREGLIKAGGYYTVCLEPKENLRIAIMRNDR